MTTTLSINLPDALAKASQEAAAKMGVSRTEFIRQAIAHEIRQFELHLEEEAIISSMQAMKKSKDYLREANKVIDSFGDDLPGEKDQWWKK